MAHSGGEIFGLFALFNHPDTFNRYVIVSPTIFRGDRAILSDEQDYAESHDDLPARVFLCVGAREETNDPIANGFEGNVLSSLQMVTNVKALAKILRERNYPSLDLTSHIFKAETNLSVFPAAFSRSLREVFG